MSEETTGRIKCDFLRWIGHRWYWCLPLFWSLIAFFRASYPLSYYVFVHLAPKLHFYYWRFLFNLVKLVSAFCSRLSFTSSSTCNISSSSTAVGCQGWDWMHCSPSQCLIGVKFFQDNRIKGKKAHLWGQDFGGIFSFPPVTYRTVETCWRTALVLSANVELYSLVLAFEPNPILLILWLWAVPSTKACSVKWTLYCIINVNTSKMDFCLTIVMEFY